MFAQGTQRPSVPISMQPGAPVPAQTTGTLDESVVDTLKRDALRCVLQCVVRCCQEASARVTLHARRA
jgi:hypothetical protein